ncbi:MAG: PhoU domain-containing protein [Lachnospiraceae bacterium]
MGRITRENMDRAFEAALSYDKEKIDKVYEVEKTINNMEKLITEYLVKLSNLPLTEDQHVVVSNMFYSVSDIERVGDHVENIAELVDVKEGVDKIEFSEQALQDLKSIMGLVTNSFAYAMSAREHSDISDAKKVVKYEDMVDNMEEELREQHIERLSKQLCKPTNGVVFLDIISNLERISDHAYNLAGYVMSEE